MMMRTRPDTLLVFLLLVMSASAFAASPWPATPERIHAKLLQRSGFYQHMVSAITLQHKLAFRVNDQVALGTVVDTGDTLEIQLNPSLKGPRLVSVIIWEIANAYQRDTFDEIGRRVAVGEITTPREYGLRMELVEYSSFRFHKQVLDDLAAKLGDLDGEYLFFINPDLKKLSDYNLPYVHDYIDAQAAGGHTAHYEKWFWKIQKQAPANP